MEVLQWIRDEAPVGGLTTFLGLKVYFYAKYAIRYCHRSLKIRKTNVKTEVTTMSYLSF